MFPNTLGTFPTRITIDSITGSGFVDMKIADIDNDKDEDLIVIADTRLLIFYNDGTGQFTRSLIDPGLSTENYALTLGDIDGDGYKEVIIGGVRTLIYKNTKGVISFDSMRTNFLNSQFFNGLVFLVDINDFDNDGDNDLLIGGSNQTDLRWHTNDGTGLFTIAQVFETNALLCTSIVSQDFDNDGDIDVLTTFSQAGQVVWYENDGTGIFGPSNLIHQGIAPFTKVVHSDDLNNDGKYDAIWSQQLSFNLNNSIATDLIFSSGFEL